MLVRGRVEDDRAADARRRARASGLVADVGDEGSDLDLGARPAELAVDLEEGDLGALDEQEPGGLEAGHLARELGADRAARAGHHDALAGQELAELGLVEVDRLAAEQVLDLDVADPGHLDLALQDLVEAGDDPDADLDLPAETDQPQDLLAGDLGDRDDDLRDAELLDEAGQVFRRAEDAEAVDDGALLLGIVVDEALDVEIHVPAALDLARREHAGPARRRSEAWAASRPMPAWAARVLLCERSYR